MKNIVILFVLLIILSVNGFAQDSQIMDKPKVDKRVELLSTVAHVAGYEEYNMNFFNLYMDRIDNYFASYKDHDLIRFMKKIRNDNGIGYDAVMAMAVHLDENLNPRKEFTAGIPESRWVDSTGYEFVCLLKQFYKDTDYDKFFRDNQDLYNDASQRFLPVFDHLDLKWYSSFYGKEPTEKFIVINGLVNGGSNYGVSFSPTAGKKEVYAIMGAWSMDSVGKPTFAINEYFPTLLHEFNHSFVNYLTDNNPGLFEENGIRIFDVIGDDMKSQAYSNWLTVLNEALVRAAVIKYMKDHNFDAKQIEGETHHQISRGFFWIEGLVAELENYDKQRDIYPTLESYLPNLAKAYAGFADSAAEYQKKRPIVTSISEFENGDTNVSAEIKKITINFDRPMLGERYSIYYGNKGKEAYPEFGNITYSEDKKSIVMEVKLKKGKEYQFVLAGRNFVSQEGIGIKNYEVNFKVTE